MGNPEKNPSKISARQAGELVSKIVFGELTEEQIKLLQASAERAIRSPKVRRRTGARQEKINKNQNS